MRGCWKSALAFRWRHKESALREEGGGRTSSRMAVRHLMRALKSPLPRTLRSSQSALMPEVVRDDLPQLKPNAFKSGQPQVRSNRDKAPTHAFSSGVLNDILLTVPRIATGSSALMNSDTPTSLNNV